MTDLQLPPFSQEAEEATIGAILINPDALLSLVQFLRPEHFFLLRTQYIYAAALRLAKKGDGIDFLTIQSELKEMGRLQDAGGPPAILNLINNTPSSIHAEIYARIVYRAAIRRQILRAAELLRETASNETMPLEEVLATAQGTIFELIGMNLNKQDEHRMDDLVAELLDEIERAIEDPQNRPTISTGFRDLDSLLGGGWWPGDLSIVAGRPGSGKTAFLLSSAMAAAEKGKRVGITSLEMSALSLTRRLASMRSGVGLMKLRTGELSKDEWALLLQHASNLSKLAIVTNDKPAQSVEQVYATFRRWLLEFDVQVAYIDYLQLFHEADKSISKRQAENRTRQVDEMMVMLKELARSLNIPVIVAAQINRGPEQRQDKRPTNGDLRESGGIEANADNVLMVFREIMYNSETEHPDRAEIIVTKQRNGPTDTVALYYDRQRTHFQSGYYTTIGSRGGGASSFEVGPDRRLKDD